MNTDKLYLGYCKKCGDIVPKIDTNCLGCNPHSIDTAFYVWASENEKHLRNPIHFYWALMEYFKDG